MDKYLGLLRDIKLNGELKGDRTGTGVISVFGRQLRFNLAEGFPLLTTKKIFTNSVIQELLWFLDGDTNIKRLNDNNCHIWDAWADEQGNLGPVYGHQWRSWPDSDSSKTIDQISEAIQLIKHNPESRRIVISAWNPADLPKMALPPCHCLFQFYVAQGKLSCQLYQRSCDVFLGLPFNIASYSLLTHMMAQQCELEVGEFVWTGGDTHLYNNHMAQVETQLTRTPKELPQLEIARKPKDIFSYQAEDFKFLNYNPDPYIKADISV